MKILLNKATSDYNFINLSSIFTIFRILASNDIDDMAHAFGCHENQFGGKLSTIVTKIGILLIGC